MGRLIKEKKVKVMDQILRMNIEAYIKNKLEEHPLTFQEIFSLVKEEFGICEKELDMVLNYMDDDLLYKITLRDKEEDKLKF